MRKIVLLLLCLSGTSSYCQTLKLAKGAINDSLVVKGDSVETYALYLPTQFTMSKTWPVLFLFDMKGNARRTLAMFTAAAEEEGYILASPNNISDTLSLSDNVLVANRMLNTLFEIVPVHKERTYVGGIGSGGRFASLLPTFIDGIKGVLSCGAAIANTEVLVRKKPFYFVGIAGRSDYNYREIMAGRSILDNLGFPNLMLVFEGEHQWAPKEEIARAMRAFTLSEMAKGSIPRKDSIIQQFYESSLVKANNYVLEDKPLLAEMVLDNTMKIYHPLGDLDSLKTSKKVLRRSKNYRDKKRLQNNYFLKESLMKEDYGYYLEEDVLTYNYNNLGWWNFQMSELDKLDKGKNEFERRMSSRLRGFLNALISDNIDLIASNKEVDMEALNFLYMVKTISDPKDYKNYLRVISYSAQMEDHGTALFYLEELLKTGYANKDELYDLEHTALFRITPEFNALVAKYLKDARYDGIEE